MASDMKILFVFNFETGDYSFFCSETFLSLRILHTFNTDSKGVDNDVRKIRNQCKKQARFPLWAKALFYHKTKTEGFFLYGLSDL